MDTLNDSKRLSIGQMGLGDRLGTFARIREALRVEAPLKHPAERSAGGEPTTAHFREWLPQVGDGGDDRLALFERLSAVLKTELIQCSDLSSAADKFVAMGRDLGWTRLAYQEGATLEPIVSLFRAENPLASLLRVESGYDKMELEQAQVGLTVCELLVAQTGSVCVTSLQSGGRVLSVLPEHHVVVAYRSQIVGDLSDAYTELARRYPKGYPSMISFITGPSRTGDIERILVLGAHGPKRLTVLLVD
jgi:L-lactate dehydrogenase complex protein LldG